MIQEQPHQPGARADAAHHGGRAGDAAGRQSLPGAAQTIRRATEAGQGPQPLHQV
jgi:hypothetical protein